MDKDTKSFLIFAVVLLGLLTFLWHRSFVPSQVPFANDGPLGLMSAETSRTPLPFQSRWNDLEWLGLNNDVPNSFTTLFTYIVGPLWYLKLAPIISCWLLGCSMWLFINRLGLVKPACWFAGLAMGLNGDAFSYAAWGLSTLPLCMASTIMAMTFLIRRK